MPQQTKIVERQKLLADQGGRAPLTFQFYSFFFKKQN